MLPRVVDAKFNVRPSIWYNLMGNPVTAMGIYGRLLSWKVMTKATQIYRVARSCKNTECGSRMLYASKIVLAMCAWWGIKLWSIINLPSDMIKRELLDNRHTDIITTKAVSKKTLEKNTHLCFRMPICNRKSIWDRLHVWWSASTLFSRLGRQYKLYWRAPVSKELKLLNEV